MNAPGENGRCLDLFNCIMSQDSVYNGEGIIGNPGVPKCDDGCVERYPDQTRFVT